MTVSSSRTHSATSATPACTACNCAMHPLGLLLLVAAAAGRPWRRPEPTELVQVIYVNHAAYVYPLVRAHVQPEKRDGHHQDAGRRHHHNTPPPEADRTEASTLPEQGHYNNVNLTINPNSDTTAVLKTKVLKDCENKTETGDSTLQINCKEVDENEITDGHIVITTKMSKDEVEDEKWIWGKVESTTEYEMSSTVELDDRAAFTGDKCPDGKVKVAGKCVHEE